MIESLDTMCHVLQNLFIKVTEKYELGLSKAINSCCRPGWHEYVLNNSYEAIGKAHHQLQVQLLWAENTTLGEISQGEIAGACTYVQSEHSTQRDSRTHWCQLDSLNNHH